MANQWNPFRRANKQAAPAPALEQKSNDTLSLLAASFSDHLYSTGYGDLYAHQCLQYYSRVSVLYDAMDEIAAKGSPIRPVIWDESKQEFIRQHPLLELLQRPGAGYSGKDFRYQWLTFYGITGNACILALGDVNRPPVELQIRKPQDMNLRAGSDGYLDLVELTRTGLHFRREEVDGEFRYLDKDKVREVHISRAFNPRMGRANLWGMSRLQALAPELEQFISGNVHNDSLLKNGATPSMMFAAKGELSDKQFERLKQEIDHYFSGPKNAGRPILGENEMTVKPLSVSNKDMDWDKLLTSLTVRVYNAYDVPLPSIMAEQMTLANMDTARLKLYEEAILPALDNLNDALSDLLIPRYEDLDRDSMRITYEINTIPALEPRRMETLKGVSGTNSITTNEKRTRYLGMDEIDDPAADKVLIDSTKVPLETVEDDLETETPAPQVVEVEAQDEPQKLALSGGQITSLQAIVQAVADGAMPPDTAIQLILVAFPTLDEATARRLVDPAADWDAEPVAPAVPPVAEPAEEEDPEEMDEDEEELQRMLSIATSIKGKDGAPLFSKNQIRDLAADIKRVQEGGDA